MNEDNGLKIGDIVIFNYDHRGMDLAGKHGVVERQELNLGWVTDIIRSEDNRIIEIDWANRDLVSIADDGWKPKRKEPIKVHRVQFSFKWYDLWVGAFIDSENRTVYVCPLPCCVIEIRY